MGHGAAIYTRISVDRTGDHEAPARQEADCRAAAKRLGLRVVEVFTDRDASAFATNSKRPEWERLMADVEAGAVDVVLAWTVDRFHRNRDDWYRTGTLIDAGFRFIFDRDGIDTHTEYGAQQYDARAQAARDESRRISMRVRRALEDRARAGKPHTPGGRVYGYTADWQVIPAEADYVRQAAARVLEGASLTRIARELVDDGMRTTGGKPWTMSNLGRLLRSPSVAGMRRHHDEVYAGTWEPLLDADTWRGVVAALDRRRGSPGGGRRTRLLTGVAFCECGGRMNGIRNGKGLPRYQCQSALKVRETGEPACGKVGIIGDPLDDLVTQEVLAALDGAGLRAATASRQRVDPANAAIADQLDELRTRMDELAADFYARRLLTRSEYLAARKALEAESAQLSSRLRVTARAATLGQVGPDIRAWWETADADARRAVIMAVLDCVVVGPVRRGGKGFDAERVSFEWADRQNS